MSDQMETSVLVHVIYAAQISLGIVFLLSAWPKLRHPLAFARNAIEYEVLPAPIGYIFGLVVIPVETILAITLLTGWYIDMTLPLAAGFLFAFLLGVRINLKRGGKSSMGVFV